MPIATRDHDERGEPGVLEARHHSAASAVAAVTEERGTQITDAVDERDERAGGGQPLDLQPLHPVGPAVPHDQRCRAGDDAHGEEERRRQRRSTDVHAGVGSIPSGLLPRRRWCRRRRRVVRISRTTSAITIDARQPGDQAHRGEGRWPSGNSRTTKIAIRPMAGTHIQLPTSAATSAGAGSEPGRVQSA